MYTCTNIKNTYLAPIIEINFELKSNTINIWTQNKGKFLHRLFVE